MIALARFLILAGVVLTVIYASLWLYLRARRRALLEEDWRLRGEGGSQEDFVRDGLEHHDRLRHRFLVIAVYVLPLCTVALIVYRTNFQ